MVLRQLVVHGLSDSAKALMDIDRKKRQSHSVCGHCGLVVAQGRVYSTSPKHVADIVVVASLTRALKHAISARTATTLLTSASTAITAELLAVLQLHTSFTHSW